MDNAFSYFNDGANAQAQAVLAFLSYFAEGVEASYKDGKYAASVEVNRFHNCREQGYVLTMCASGYKKQLNIAFFEHRNSDSICIVEWESAPTLNPPTIDSIPEDHPWFNDKYNVTASFGYGEAYQTAEWIVERLNAWWH